jgi:hypothetical protein
MRKLSQLGKGLFSVLLVLIFMSSCFVKSKLDNPTDGLGGLFLDTISRVGSALAANITISGILKDSAGNILSSGILDISRSGSASILQRVPADKRVYSDGNGKFSMNVYQGSFTIKVSRADGSSVGSFSIKVSSATATPEVLSSTGLLVSGLIATPVGVDSTLSPAISTVTNPPSSIAEGNSISIGIKLTGLILQSYSISISTSNSSSVTVSPSTMVFETFNFSNEQMLTITSLQDENLISEKVKITLSSPDIKSISFDINVIDDDTQNIILDGISQINEKESKNLSVKLTKEPSSNVTVILSSSHPSSLSLSTSSLTFTPQDYNIPKIVTLNALEEFNDTSENALITATAEGITDSTRGILCVDKDLKIAFGEPYEFYEGGTNAIPISLSNNGGIARVINLSISGQGNLSVNTNTSILVGGNILINGLSDTYSGGSTLTASADFGNGTITISTPIPPLNKFKIKINVSGVGVYANYPLTIRNKNSYETLTISSTGNFEFSKTSSKYNIVPLLYLSGNLCSITSENDSGVAFQDIVINISCEGSYNPSVGDSYVRDLNGNGKLKRIFLANGDGNGPWTDNISGVIYSPIVNSTATFSDAQAICNSLNLANYQWRLPNYRELTNFFDWGSYGTVQNQWVMSGLNIWSGETRDNEVYANDFSFYGRIFLKDKNSTGQVLCVSGTDLSARLDYNFIYYTDDGSTIQYRTLEQRISRCALQGLKHINFNQARVLSRAYFFNDFTIIHDSNNIGIDLMTGTTHDNGQSGLPYSNSPGYTICY